MVSVFLGWDLCPTTSAHNLSKLICDCPNEDSCDKEAIFTPLYVPGTIYWLTYDYITSKIEDLYLIKPNSPRLDNVIMSEFMDDDHSMTKIYIYLLALVKKYSSFK